MATEVQDSAGPSSPPPPLPEGWLAQWEGVSRKWYYVQRATGKSQWDVPTEPVILTPSTTPGSIGMGPTQAPGAGYQPLSPETLAADPSDMDRTRGFFGSSTMRPSLSNVLGSHGSSGISQIADRVLSSLSKEFLPGKQTKNESQQYSYGSGSNTWQNQAGYNSYGYPPSDQSSNYSGNAQSYYPQGQQQGEIPQLPGSPNEPYGPAGSSGYSHYQTGSHPAMSNQFPAMSPGSQPPPWQTQNSFAPTDPLAYPPPQVAQGQINGPPIHAPPEPEWHTGPLPAVPHSTKPTMNHLSQPPSKDQLVNPSQTQPPSDFQPPYHHQQAPEHANQPVQNTYAHGQMNPGYPNHPEAMYGPQVTAGPIQHNQPPPPNNFQQTMQPQHPSFQGPPLPPQHPPPHPSPYNANSGMASVPPLGTPKYENMSTTPVSVTMTNSGSQQSNNLPSQPVQYPPNSMSNNPSAPTFAIELPDNQINTAHQMNPAGQIHGQPFPQTSVAHKPPNPMAVEMPGSTPVRHTPTDPQFVSGPWTSPPASTNHHFPPNRYNNPGGY